MRFAYKSAAPTEERVQKGGRALLLSLGPPRDDSTRRRRTFVLLLTRATIRVELFLATLFPGRRGSLAYY